MIGRFVLHFIQKSYCNNTQARTYTTLCKNLSIIPAEAWFRNYMRIDEIRLLCMHTSSLKFPHLDWIPVTENRKK